MTGKSRRIFDEQILGKTFVWWLTEALFTDMRAARQREDMASPDINGRPLALHIKLRPSHRTAVWWSFCWLPPAASVSYSATKSGRSMVVIRIASG